MGCVCGPPLAGMLELVRKAGTARNLNRMLMAVGKDYKFFPRTFLLPADYTELKKEFGDKNRGNKTFIVKPSQGCQGTGIMLTRSLDQIDPNEPNIVQRYMHRPHLLDGYKYDLRLYVLLSSIEPLRIFLFREGLVRVCTEKYAPLERVGVQDRFGESGQADEMLDVMKISSSYIAEAAMRAIARKA